MSLLRYGGTDRTEHHPGEPAAAVATDDDELSLLSLFKKMADGPLELDNALDRDLRIAFLPTGKALGKRLVRRRLHDRGVNAVAVDMSASLHTCNATKSTPRQEASSNAISVANSDARDPSIPTTTGSRSD